MDEAVPVKAFRSFMSKVDRVLANDEPYGEPVKPQTECGMQFEGLKITRGTLGFILNGKFIGSANMGNGPLVFSYPCSFIDREKNILSIQNLDLIENANIDSTQFKVLPIVAGKKIDRESLSHYWRGDKSYQGSKYEFSLLHIIPTAAGPFAGDPAGEERFHIPIQISI